MKTSKCLFIILAALVFAYAQSISINANYGKVTVPKIDPYQYTWGACTGDFPVDQTEYQQLVGIIGARALHIPSSAYVGWYNWLTG
jgi:hypothetical protein